MTKHRSKSTWEKPKKDEFSKQFQEYCEHQKQQEPSSRELESWCAIPYMPSESLAEGSLFLGRPWTRFGLVAALCLAFLFFSGWQLWHGFSSVMQQLGISKAPESRLQTPSERRTRHLGIGKKQALFKSTMEKRGKKSRKQRVRRTKPSLWQLALARLPKSRLSSQPSFPRRLVGSSSSLVRQGGLRKCIHRNKTLKYYERYAPRSLHPLWANDQVSLRTLDWGFDRLVGVDPEGKFTLGVARNWNISHDGRSITFELHSDLHWHWRGTVSAEDVVFTIRAWQHHYRHFDNFSLAKIVKKVEALGAHRVRVHLFRRWSQPLRWFQFHVFPAPKRPQEKRSFVPWMTTQKKRFAKKIIGSGPFYLHQYGASLVFKRNPWVPRRSPWTCWKKIVVAVKKYALIDEDIWSYHGYDLIADIKKPKSNKWKERSKYSLLSIPRAIWSSVTFNQNKGRTLQNPRIRKALYLAFDRTVFSRYQKIHRPFLGAPWLGKYAHLFDARPAKRNLLKAQRLLKQAKWKFRNTRKVTLALLKDSRYRSMRRSLFFGWIHFHSRIGIDYREYSTRQLERVLREKKYDMAVETWQTKDSQMLWELFHANGRNNKDGYQDLEVSQLLDSLVSSSDWTQEKSTLRSLQKRLQQNPPRLFLAPVGQYSVVSKRLKNLSIDPEALFRWGYNWSK